MAIRKASGESDVNKKVSFESKFLWKVGDWPKYRNIQRMKQPRCFENRVVTGKKDMSEKETKRKSKSKSPCPEKGVDAIKDEIKREKMIDKAEETEVVDEKSVEDESSVHSHSKEDVIAIQAKNLKEELKAEMIERDANSAQNARSVTPKSDTQKPTSTPPKGSAPVEELKPSKGPTTPLNTMVSSQNEIPQVSTTPIETTPMRPTTPSPDPNIAEHSSQKVDPEADKKKLMAGLALAAQAKKTTGSEKVIPKTEEAGVSDIDNLKSTNDPKDVPTEGNLNGNSKDNEYLSTDSSPLEKESTSEKSISDKPELRSEKSTVDKSEPLSEKPKSTTSTSSKVSDSKVVTPIVAAGLPGTPQESSIPSSESIISSNHEKQDSSSTNQDKSKDNMSANEADKGDNDNIKDNSQVGHTENISAKSGNRGNCAAVSVPRDENPLRVSQRKGRRPEISELTQISKQGPLLKKGFLWSSKYQGSLKEGTLTLNRSKCSKKVSVTGCELTEKGTTRYKGRTWYGMMIKGDSGSVKLYAESEDERRSWMESLASNQ